MLDSIIEYMPYVWTLTLIMCVLMEAATAALTAIWFMPAGFACLVMSLFNVPLPVQIVSYVVISAVTLIIAKAVLRRRGKLEPAPTPTNADRVIGETAKVTVAIDNTAPAGEVMVRGQIWTARSATDDSFAAGEDVVVDRIEGVKLIVKRK